MTNNKLEKTPSVKTIVFIYGVLLILGIPWYWPEQDMTMILGVPAWVTVVIVVSFFIALFTAYLLLKYPWPGEEDTDSSNQQ